MGKWTVVYLGSEALVKYVERKSVNCFGISRLVLMPNSCMLQHTIPSDYDVRMAKRKVETCYCTTPRRFTMVVMLVQRVRVQADHNVTSNERVVLLDVMEETVEARDAAEGACVVVVKERASAFSGLEKQHSDLDRTMQFLGAREGLPPGLKGVTLGG